MESFVFSFFLLSLLGETLALYYGLLSNFVIQIEIKWHIFLILINRSRENFGVEGPRETFCKFDRNFLREAIKTHMFI
jgi:hypothetical protein